MKIFLSVLIIGSMVAAVARATYKAQERAELAREWSADGAQFASVGLDNRTLLAVLPYSDAATCDAYVDDLIQDAKVSQELQAVGFETVQCSGRVEQLKGRR
jgi:hypothetical protein